MSTISSASYLLSLLLIQTFASVLAGQITMRTGYMRPQIIFGFTVWTIGQGLVTMLDETYGTGDGSGGVGGRRARIVGFLVVCGIGVGATLQTSEFAFGFVCFYSVLWCWRVQHKGSCPGAFPDD